MPRAGTAEPMLHNRILAHAADLTTQQRVIGEFVLEHLGEIPFLSVPQLAERTGTSDATVVRFCQRIGFSGYSDLKMALVDGLREGAVDATGETTAVNDDDVLAAVARLERHNIDRTLDGIESSAFRSAAATLFKADHVFTFGMGISAYLADFATYLFTEHGLRASSLPTRYTSPLEQLVVLRPADLVVVFSFPPYSKPTLELLIEARQRGIPTLAITNSAIAPAVELADQSLAVSSHGMMLTNATSSVNVLLNALVVEIASRHRGETVEAISGLNRIFRDRSDAVDDIG
ncbi:MAG: MurR/RpiR family transcriptional regulator [Xanthomonadales bacterium]|nr:MurR/RpiR family transcriptional regulator [Xanthomonadales bacterium]